MAIGIQRTDLTDEELRELAGETDDASFETDEEWPADDRESDAGDAQAYADRLHELAGRDFESEDDADRAVGEVLNEMERDFFFGKLVKRLKRGGLKGLLKKGLKLAAGAFPGMQGLQAITQLSRGNLKGMLGSLAKAGLASAVPGGAAVLPALSALGFEAGEDEPSREAWGNFARLAQESYEQLADDLHENADLPADAARLASGALEKAMRRFGAGRAGHAPAGRGAARRVTLRRGDVLTIQVV